jgi:tetratricopeptide (TPR) repeat protein
VEQGDVYYQEHENYDQAANAYQQAGLLFPNDQIFARMLYLKRRYWEFAADQNDYQNLFRDYPPDWVRALGPDPKLEKEIVTKIMQGKLGSYLMMNWYVDPILDTTAKPRSDMDTAMVLYTRLHKMDPEEPLYTDSLATLLIRRGDLRGGERLFSQLEHLYPFGSESAAYRLAWTKFKLGKLGEISALLRRCKGFSGEAKYLTMLAAGAMENGHYRSAFSSLSRSLKLDKSIGETHALMEAYHHHKGNKAAEKVHHLWQRRSI